MYEEKLSFRNDFLDLEESKLPKQVWWGNNHLYQIGDFWFLPQFLHPISRVINTFKPLPTDILLASFPKTGTTWLKSLIFAIVHRSSAHKHRLSVEHPHELVPTLEVQVYNTSSTTATTLMTTTTPSPTGLERSLSSPPRIFSTHIPYQLLAKTLDASPCRIVYVTRNPKDTLVSMWHFLNKWEKAKEEPWPLEVAADNFCRGVSMCGPYYDHVLGYRQLLGLDKLQVFFITYEELVNDPQTHVKNLAKFLGCPFGEGEGEGEEAEEDGVLEVVRRCSFEVLRKHEVNKSEESPSWFQLPYNSFFRRATVGDHKNYLNDDMIRQIDTLTKAKFHSTGFLYGT